MIDFTMNPEEVKRYFEKNPPPQEVAWKPWVRITDTQKFLNSCYVTIGGFKGNIEACPSWWHLKEFYQDMLEKSRQ
ncbi:hypothetical protein LRS05_10550 [Flavobacterium sp. J372]|uniref:DUF6965 family protein n=1 Tax=Flavobacterium sp. J372 TaxID=2898436 RepID=UPI0021510249|nr:hypothetical protein [Flavobacterium sp. J372]MCR5862560.1 hypothetical protein [Flavobacterium sp. J372]MDC7218214.1 hypothetical protein [Spirochaetales bacterium]